MRGTEALHPAGPDDPPTRPFATRWSTAFVATLALATLSIVGTPLSRSHMEPGDWTLWVVVGGLPVFAGALRRRLLPGVPLQPIQRLALLLAAAIGLSGTIHLLALTVLDAATVVSVSGLTAIGARQAVLEGTLLHLVLPFAIFALSTLLERRAEAAPRLALALPLVLVPSALVAIYQFFVRIDLWNVPHFARLERASGLSYDANSLAASLFLMLPLVALSIVKTRSRLHRATLTGVALLFAGAMAMTGNRASFAATLGLAVLSPWIVLWTAPPVLRAARIALALAPLALAAAVATMPLVVDGLEATPTSGPGRFAAALEQVAAGDAGRLFDASGRRDLWHHALRLLAQAPIAGVGPGGFARELPNSRFRDRARDWSQPLDLAGSHYLQIAAELGALGLFLHLVLLAGSIAAAARGAATLPTAGRRLRAAVVCATLLVAAALLQFNHYVLFPDVAWLLAALFALATTEQVDQRAPLTRLRWRTLAGAILVAMAFATLATAFGPAGYRARSEADWWPFRFDSGCYPAERWDGVETRWCSPAAWLAVPVAVPGDRAVVLSLLALHPDLEREPLALRLRSPAGRQWDLDFEHPAWQALYLPVTEADLRTCRDADGRRARCLAIRLEASRGWRPSEWSASRDERSLGVAVRTRRLPDRSLAPGYLFADDFEEGEIARWRLGEE